MFVGYVNIELSKKKKEPKHRIRSSEVWTIVIQIVKFIYSGYYVNRKRRGREKNVERIFSFLYCRLMSYRCERMKFRLERSRWLADRWQFSSESYLIKWTSWLSIVFSSNWYCFLTRVIVSRNDERISMIRTDQKTAWYSVSISNILAMYCLFFSPVCVSRIFFSKKKKKKKTAHGMKNVK